MDEFYFDFENCFCCVEERVAEEMFQFQDDWDRDDDDDDDD